MTASLGMVARSWLFVPADAERKLAKAGATGAEALILDLEDAVAAERLPEARRLARAFLTGARDPARQQVWVRINGLGTGKALEDLAAVMPGRPDGIVLPKAGGAEDVRQLGHYLSALEVGGGAQEGTTRILAIATETAASLFALGGYAAAGPRLLGLAWGAEDLATALGVSSNREPGGGSYTQVFQLARSLCLAGAAAAGIAAVDTPFTDYRNLAGLEAEARLARRDGLCGKLAIHPDQVDVIHKAFTPDVAEVAAAERIVAAFAAAGAAGAVGLDGRMLDRPHLAQAERTLALARRSAGKA